MQNFLKLLSRIKKLSAHTIAEKMRNLLTFSVRRYVVTKEQQPQYTTTITPDPAEQIVQHLLHTPSDLIDTRRLMRHFRASVDDVLRAFTQLEQLALPQEGNARC